MTIWEAEEVLKARAAGIKKLRLVVDAGLVEVDAILAENGVLLGEEGPVPYEDLENIREGFVYKVVGGRLVRLDTYADGRYYKLKPVAPRKPPTLEISGIQMHRTTGIDPWTDSELKVATLGKLSGRTVLDICTGLGYTASIEATRGARSVITVEVDANVLEIARYNPWSRGLGDSRISIVVADASEYVANLEDSSFDAVLHDPPRIGIAGELYSFEFYRELYRVMKPGGRLFHYVGEPGKHTNVSYIKGVKTRLKAVGFRVVRWVDTAKGFISVKPLTPETTTLTVPPGIREAEPDQ